MPSLKAIRSRIASVKSNQKITKAMKLVAAARLRKATQAIVELRPYARKTAEVLGALAARGGDEGSDEAQHPLLVSRPVKTAAILVLTSDRGLAGAFNTNVQRAVDRRLREVGEEGVDNVMLVTLGRKGRDFFRRRGVDIAHDYTGAFAGGSHRAAEIARQLIDDFKEGRVDRVEVAYTEFRSAISQRVVVEQLLPVQPTLAPAEGAAPAGSSRALVSAGGEASRGTSEAQGDFLYEPDRDALLERLLPMYVEVMVYRAMLESVASEHGARMTAMENATKNAKKMIDTLTLQYNRVRQAAITKELMEIIGGAEALRGA